MRNFNYVSTNKSINEGARVIALKDSDVEKLINAANMMEPEIAATAETVVEPTVSAGEAMVQPEAPVAPGAPVGPVAPEVSPAPNVVESSEMNIPEPVGVPVSEAATQPEVNYEGNMFDQPEIREEVAQTTVAPGVVNTPVNEAPVQPQPQTQAQQNASAVDYSGMVAQYNALSSNIREMLDYQDRLVNEMSKVMGQTQVDNNAYANAIDGMVNEGIKRSA